MFSHPASIPISRELRTLAPCILLPPPQGATTSSATWHVRWPVPSATPDLSSLSPLQGAAMSSAIVALQRSGASPELSALPLLRFVILLGGLRVSVGL